MSHGNKQQWILAKRPQDVPDPSEVVFQEVSHSRNHRGHGLGEEPLYLTRSGDPPLDVGYPQLPATHSYRRPH